MFNDTHKLLLGLALLGPSSALANVIHWEVNSNFDPNAYWWGEGGDENFILSGGFDLNTDTGTISNITVKTSGAAGCVACNDFSDGGIGEFSIISFDGAVTFTESYGPNIYSPGSYWLQILGEGFDPSTPGTHATMDISYWGQTLLYDPFDPNTYMNIGCYWCVSMIGTLSPVPEPETYTLMLVGLGILGWRAKRKTSFNAQGALMYA
ncbi:MAG: PEP-CTERM sorting domain-containing protein [Methylotenera sp.]|uniref:PEP-CTERM sorting domain-containing protein n=1 Tax=Methylotenera sp. TaxID=2051956 RepID=UPI00271A3181|nr:PEP-CTERM sorting domain-containing protein [Methylotenera sp.]MDO9151907.1 PEP-CTERM sorting domain-containing protein [Methylotenera sp.]